MASSINSNPSPMARSIPIRLWRQCTIKASLIELCIRIKVSSSPPRSGASVFNGIYTQYWTSKFHGCACAVKKAINEIQVNSFKYFPSHFFLTTSERQILQLCLKRSTLKWVAHWPSWFQWEQVHISIQNVPCTHRCRKNNFEQNSLQRKLGKTRKREVQSLVWKGNDDFQWDFSKTGKVF